MARDFPADKYNFRLRPEMRTFGAVIVHIASGNVYAAKAGRGEKVKWDELDPAKYKDKAAIVGLFEKTSADAMNVLKGVGEAHFSKTLDPWLSVMEHSAEHYGLLVAITGRTDWCRRSPGRRNRGTARDARRLVRLL